MRIFIGGVACVGKTTTGAKLADLLKWRFIDLDTEAEKFFGTSIERLQESRDCVIALSPRGLMGPCWRVIKKMKDAVIVVLNDTPENILNRITFYDIDSRRIKKVLSGEERRHYLREIKGDITYFRRSWQNANLIVDIAGCDANESARKVKEELPATP